MSAPPQAEVVEVISLICNYLKEKGLTATNQVLLEECKEKLKISEIATNVRDLGDILTEYLQIRKERIRSQTLVNDETVSEDFCKNINKVVKGMSELIQDYISARDFLERKQQETVVRQQSHPESHATESVQVHRGIPGNKKVEPKRTSSSRESAQTNKIAQVVGVMSAQLKQRDSSKGAGAIVPPPPIPLSSRNPSPVSFELDAHHGLSNLSFPNLSMPGLDGLSRSRMNDVGCDDLGDWNTTGKRKLGVSEDSLSAILKSDGLSNFFQETDHTRESENGNTDQSRAKRRITPQIVSSSSVRTSLKHET